MEKGLCGSSGHETWGALLQPQPYVRPFGPIIGHCKALIDRLMGAAALPTPDVVNSQSSEFSGRIGIKDSGPLGRPCSCDIHLPSRGVCMWRPFDGSPGWGTFLLSDPILSHPQPFLIPYCFCVCDIYTTSSLSIHLLTDTSCFY